MTSTKTNNWRTSTKAWKNESTKKLKWLPTMFSYCHWDLILSQKYQSMNYTIPPGKNGMTAWIGFLHPWAWHTRSIGLLLLLRTSAQVEHTDIFGLSSLNSILRGPSTTSLSVNIVVSPYLIDFPSCHMRGMCTKKSQMELSWVLCQPFHFN